MSNVISQDVISKKRLERRDATGIESLDKAMGGGLHRGKVYCIGGEEKVGKSLLLGTIAYDLALAKIPHLFISTEMLTKDIAQRMIARLLKIDLLELIASPPTLSKDFFQSNHSYLGNCVFLDASGGWSGGLNQMKSDIVEGIRKYSPRGIIIDSWQFIPNNTGRFIDGDSLLDVAQWVTKLCQEYKIWGLISSQMDNKGECPYVPMDKLMFDQIYKLNADDNGGAWLDMLCSRNTMLHPVGSEALPSLVNVNGTHFRSN